MRTVEFKLSLNQYQEAKIDSWLNTLRWVWNRGLHLLEEFNKNTHWDKNSKSWVPCCPIQWEYYKNDDDELIPFSRMAQTKPYRMSCPIQQLYQKPELESPTHFGLLYYFAQKNHPDKPWLCDVPSKVVAGTLKSLSDAWSEYKAGKHKRPKYKRYKNKLNTLVNNNSKSIKISGKQITLPKLGKVTVKTLEKRWDASVPIATLKIVREPSGYYLQLTGDLPLKRLKPSNKAVGISLGYKDLFTTDGGKVVKPPSYYHRMEKRLQRLQRKLSRQEKLCPISTYNPKLKEHLLSCPINPHKSANKIKTQNKISRQHEKIRRTRRAFNHKLSAKLVQEYGALATVKSEVHQITRRPKPIVNKSGTGYDCNGASVKSQFNKSVLEKGLGQLVTMIEQKAIVNEREFIKVTPKEIPDRQKQQAKLYSKQLRLPRAVYTSSFFGRYRAWSWELKPGESQGTLNQEASQVAAPRDAGTTSKYSSKNTNLSLNQQLKESLPSNGETPNHATSPNCLDTSTELPTPCKTELLQQPQKAGKHSSVPLTSKQLGKRRPPVENDFS